MFTIFKKSEIIAKFLTKKDAVNFICTELNHETNLRIKETSYFFGVDNFKKHLSLICCQARELVLTPITTKQIESGFFGNDKIFGNNTVKISQSQAMKIAWQIERLKVSGLIKTDKNDRLKICNKHLFQLNIRKLVETILQKGLVLNIENSQF